MNQPNQIRVIVLGLIRDDNPQLGGLTSRVLLSEGYDPGKQEKFYRALGGGVDFGETSYEALKREFQEELAAEVTNIKYLGCIENLFIYNGQPGHEIVQLYQCDFVDPKFYQLDELEFFEGNSKGIARWVTLEQCKFGQIRVVPEQFLDYLT